MNRVWNVFISNANRRTIEKYNIFDHHYFCAGCDKAYKKCVGEKDAFAEEVRRELMYYYWSKCEWEIIIKGFIIDGKERKIDVYEQVMLNWDEFIKYLWHWYEARKWVTHKKG